MNDAPAVAPPAVSMRNALLEQGRGILARIRRGDVESVFASFNPEMANAVPKRDLITFLGGVAGLSPAIADGAVAISRQGGLYAAEATGADGTLVRTTVVLDAANKIAGLKMEPAAPLPPDPRANYSTKSSVFFPAEGEWLVVWGGNTWPENQHVVAADQRHAYDLSIFRDGATYKGAGQRLDDYWAWGRPIAAPADGAVAAAVDGIEDGAPGARPPRGAPAGNHVVLDLGGGEFLVIAHLQRESVAVRSGQTVRRGAIVGLCGNSGNSSEPHLHVHLQDQPRLFGEAQGLPLAFEGVRVLGAAPGRRALKQGDLVTAA